MLKDMFGKEVEEKFYKECQYKKSFISDSRAKILGELNVFLLTCKLGRWSKEVNKVNVNGISVQGAKINLLCFEIAQGCHFRKDLEVRYFVVLTDTEELNERNIKIKIGDDCVEALIGKESEFNYCAELLG